MNNNINQSNNNFFKTAANYLKDHLKAVIISFSIIFLIFLIYQGYSYYNINKTNNLSISYFENKDAVDNFIKLSEMNKISSEKGFYSVLAKLELIEMNIEKNEFDKSIELYNQLFNSNDLDSNYISLLAINAAYKFLDIVIKNNNYQFITDINKFISIIDEELENFIGTKNELLYLVSVLSLNDDSSYKNNSELLTLYDNLMNNEKISSTIKERVKKIHEFYIFI